MKAWSFALDMGFFGTSSRLLTCITETCGFNMDSTEDLG
jgi:hypothetical protein